MSDQAKQRKQILFVDDDTNFLNSIWVLFSEMSAGSWQVFTAGNHAQALSLLQKQPMDLVVADLEMPVMDGLQFLRLLGRAHPNQQVAILTGHASEEKRRACLESGAVLFLEKVAAPDGLAAVFATLDALVGSAAHQDGFRGLMRRVGLQDVLQMECLSRKSSILDVSTGNAHGRVFIHDGAIVHAEFGSAQGEGAFYKLLGLKGGRFTLLPFSEPANRTISGQYEFLLMEAARLNDESSQAAATRDQPPATEESFAPPLESVAEAVSEPSVAPVEPALESVCAPVEPEFESIEGIAALPGESLAVAPTPPLEPVPSTIEPLLISPEPLDAPPAPSPEPEEFTAIAPAPPAELSAVPDDPASSLDRVIDLSQSNHLKVSIQEVLLCSGAGEVLYDWQCANKQARIGLLERVSRQMAHLGTLLPAGRFERLQIVTAEERMICQVQSQMRLFMRRTAKPIIAL